MAYYANNRCGPSTNWTIEADGSFTIERLLDGKPVAPARTGELAPEDLEGIAAVLAAQGLQDFPAEAGAADKVNARSLKLTFGEHTSVLWLPAGEGVTGLVCADAASDSLGGPAKVAAAVVGALGTLDGGPASAEGDACE
jgi:hypothetical protein